MRSFRLPAAAMVAWLLLLSCHGPSEPRVIVLGLDGLDPRVVDLLISEGRLPNLERMKELGAYGTLRSQEPILSPILWTTVATGRQPTDHGIADFVAIDPSTGARLPVTSRLRRVKALWNLASDADRTVAVVGWWATWPPEEVEGAMVSDHVAYHFLFPEGLRGSGGENRTHPPELLARIETELVAPDHLSAADLAPFVNIQDSEISTSFRFDDELSHFRWALSSARSYRDIGLRLWREDSPDLLMVYIEGTDSTSHLFGHLFRAQGLGGALAVQQQRYGNAVEEMYRFADDLVGRYLEAIDEQTTLVVLSDHGFDLGALHDDPTRSGDLRRVSERFHNLDGVLFLAGPRVRPGARIEEASILDVTPTVLTLLELPASEEMPGRVLHDALDGVNAPERVKSYESREDTTPVGSDGIVDERILQHLEALGYLDELEQPVPSKRSDRVLAALHFRNARFEQALSIYQRLIEESPEDVELQTSMAGALGALGRYEEAMVWIDLALEQEPLSAEALHNRAVIKERIGDPEEAIADYRRALRYAPDYRPSKKALERLTGSASLFTSASQTEAEALALVDQASQAARSARYAEAMSFLDRAQTLSEELVLIYQYRANVAYLTGDQETARRALERALELEPDNELYRVNLERLEER